MSAEKPGNMTAQTTEQAANFSVSISYPPSLHPYPAEKNHQQQTTGVLFCSGKNSFK